MKRSHKTKEYILALILGVGVIVKFCTCGLNALEVSKLLAVIFNGLLFSRVLAKVSRGTPGNREIKREGSAELQAVGAQLLWNLIASEAGWISDFNAYLFMGLAVSFYAIGRGWTKLMTAKTQTMIIR